MTKPAPPDLPAGHEIEQNVPLDTLVPHPRNPRKGNVAKIRESIREHGFVDAVVIQKSTRHMLSGNHRVKAAGLEGHTVAPVVIVADVDDDQALAMLLAFNRAADEGDYDRTALLGILRELDLTTRGLEGTLYDSREIDDLRRLTGEAGREATDFLNGLVPPVDPPDTGSTGAPAAPPDPLGRDHEPAGAVERVFNLTFPFDQEQRTLVLDAVGLWKAKTGETNSAAAVADFAAAWLSLAADPDEQS